jgi:hypothetical protein
MARCHLSDRQSVTTSIREKRIQVIASRKPAACEGFDLHADRALRSSRAPASWTSPTPVAIVFITIHQRRVVARA